MSILQYLFSNVAGFSECAFMVYQCQYAEVSGRIEHICVHLVNFLYAEVALPSRFEILLMKFFKLIYHLMIFGRQSWKRVWHVIWRVLIFVVVCYYNCLGILQVDFFKHFLFAFFDEFDQIFGFQVSENSIWKPGEMVQASGVGILTDEDQFESVMRLLVKDVFWCLWPFLSFQFGFIVFEKHGQLIFFRHSW